MADDLFTWTMDNASIHLLAYGAYATSQGVIAEIRRLDDVRFVAEKLNLIDGSIESADFTQSAQDNQFFSNFNQI